MAAYYNEIDPFAAQWLRNLIAAGHIAPGEVDERDIRDVSPTDLVRFDQCHFFAGIGGWSRALRLAGIPDDAPVWTGSCPCQPFSAAGSGGGFADERHVWPAWFHLVDVCRPAKIYGEQVASPDALEWFDLVCADLENAGYAVGIADIGAAGVGAPHIRQRLYFVADAEGGGIGPGLCNREPRGIGRPVAANGGGSLVIADTTSRGFGTNGSTPGNAGHVNERGPARVMGHALESGLERLARDGDGTPRREIAARPIAEASDARGMADTEQHSGRCEAEPTNNVRTQTNRSADQHGGYCGPSVRLADSDRDGHSAGEFGSAREAQSIQGVDRSTEPCAGESWGTGGVICESRPTGPVNGRWSDADWLLCRDGKWRPVEPGAFPLAHGIPGRVGRLRAYGNAIVPQVAAEFVRATL